MKIPSLARPQPQILALALALGLLPNGPLPHALAADPADWKTFNVHNTTLNWSDAANWTAGTGVPTSGSSLVINFDPTKAGTTGTSISAATTLSNNDLGTVQLSTLNLSGVSNGSARIFNISGGTLHFSGTSGFINNTTTTNPPSNLVNYNISSNILLNGDLNVSLGGTGETTLGSGATSTISANTAGLKTIVFTGAGTAYLGGNAAAVISNGSGQIGVTQSGTGTLFMGGANTFTGDVLIKSGTVAINSSTIGTATAFGAGTIRLGDSAVSTASATLNLNKTYTVTNTVNVQSGSSGAKILENSGGNATITMSSMVLNDNLTARYTGATGGLFTFNGLSGAGNLVLESAVGTGVNNLGGSNAGFTGQVQVVSGSTRATTDTALSAANTLSIDSAVNTPTFNINARTLTIGGINNGANGGGTLTNSGAARVLTLGGNGNYVFGGAITATTTANLALTVALTGNGSQTLDGTLSYDGATLVNSGALYINGDASAANGNVTVAAGATLGGTGLIGGAATFNGNLSAGNSAGTLTFNNNLTLNGGTGLGSGANAIFEGGDLVDVNGTLTLANDWNLILTGGFQDGGSMTLFTYTTAGASLDLTPDFDISSLGFVPTGSLFLTDTGSSIVLNGLSVVPEPGAGALAGLGLAVLLYRRRR